MSPGLCTRRDSAWRNVARALARRVLGYVHGNEHAHAHGRSVQVAVAVAVNVPVRYSSREE